MAGYTYELSVHALIAADGEHAALGIAFYDAAGNWVTGHEVPISQRQYGRTSFVFTAPASSAAAYAYASKQDGVGSYLYVDNVSLRRL